VLGQLLVASALAAETDIDRLVLNQLLSHANDVTMT
jgi:hypothetical protein